MKSAKSIRDLTVVDLQALANLLSLPPDTSPLGDSWLQEQVRRISNLSSALQKHHSPISRLVTAITVSQKTAHLCPPHRLLNPHLIHQAFQLVRAECNTCLTRLAEKTAFLPPRISDFVNGLHGVNSLWMDPGLFYLTFGEVSWDSGRRGPIASGCEACILAAIGGDSTALSNIRASLKGRKKRNRPDAELLPLVEAWIGLDARSEKIHTQSNLLGSEVLRCRREIQKTRRRERRGAVRGAIDWGSLSGTATLVRGTSRDAENKEHDTEGSIVNCHTGGLSGTSGVLEDIHPSSGGTVPPSPVTKSVRRTSMVPRRSRWSSAYSESVYSNPGVATSPSSPRDSWLTHIGEKMEETVEQYRGLVVVMEE